MANDVLARFGDMVQHSFNKVGDGQGLCFVFAVTVILIAKNNLLMFLY